MPEEINPADIRRRIRLLDRRIDSIKGKLADLGPIRPGLLTRQYQRPKDKSVPYWQLSYTHRQKSHSDYIRDSLYETILPEVQNYRRFVELTQEWVDLAVERGQLSLTLLRKTAPRRPKPPRSSAKNKARGQ
jgi:hypothetical protein